MSNSRDDSRPTALVDLKYVAKAGEKRPCLVAIAGPLIGRVFAIEGQLLIGRDARCNIALVDDNSVALEHARVSTMSDGQTMGAMVQDLDTESGTFADGVRGKRHLLSEGIKLRVGQTSVFRFALLDQIEEQSQRQLSDTVLKDPATGAFNREYFEQRLGAEVKYALRHMEGLALVLFDLDGLKAVNDHHGQSVGDEILSQVASVLKRGLRSDDVLARVEADTFAIVVRAGGAEGARQLADRIVAQIGKGPLLTSAGDVKITLSAGVALFDPRQASGDAAATFLSRAEAALDRAKRAGRNRVEG